MRLRIPHPVQTWFTSIGGTSKRNPLLHRSDHATAEASASAQSNPAVLEAIQDLCYEIFAIPVATAEAVQIAQAVCGHIYEFAQSSQPPLQQLAMELLPTLVHVYLVMLANAGREEFARGGVSKTRRQPDAETQPPLHKSRAQETPLDESLSSSKVRKSFRSRVSSLAAKQSSNFLRSRQTMRQRTRKMFAGFSPQPAFRHKQQPLASQQVSQSPAVSTTTAPDPAELMAAAAAAQQTVSLVDGLPAFAANLAALSAILEACILSLYNAYALRQSMVLPASLSTDGGIPAALFGGSVFSAAIPTPAAVTAVNMLSPRLRTDLISASLLLNTPTEKLAVASSSVGSASSSSPAPPPPPLPSLLDCQTSVASTISSRGEQSERGLPLAQPRLPKEKQITASNRMRILCLLCRNYVEHVFTSSTLSREALCQLALLLGPRGMQHSLPPRLLTAKFSKHRRKKGWNKICRKRFENIKTVDVSSLASTDTLAVGTTSAQPATPIPSVEPQTPSGLNRLSTEEADAPLEGPESSTSISASCCSSTSPPSSAISSNASDDETGSNMSMYSNSSLNSGALDEQEGLPPPPPDGANSNNNAGTQKTGSDGVPDEGEDDDDDDDEYLSSTADPDPLAGCEDRRSQETSSPSFASSTAVVSSAAVSTATSKDAPLNSGAFGAPTGSQNGLTSRDGLCRTTSATSAAAALPPHSATKRAEVSTAAAAANSASTSMVAEPKRDKKQRHRKVTQRRHRNASDPASSAAASYVPPVSRIARLSSEFVLELLPGLHYLLDTELGPRSVEAIRALESRATFELWPDILLYINGITNGQSFRAAVVASQKPPNNTNQSHSASQDTVSKRSKSHRSITIGSRHRHQYQLPVVILESSKTALAEKEKPPVSLVVPTPDGLRKPSAQVFTNAGFQVLRTTEDIPPVDSPLSTASEQSLDDTASTHSQVDTIHPDYPRQKSVSPTVYGQDTRLDGFNLPEGRLPCKANSSGQIFKGPRKHKGRPVTFANPPCEIPNQPASPSHSFSPRLDAHLRPSSCIRVDSRRRSL